MSRPNPAQVRAERITAQRSFNIPRGCILCPSKPLEVHLDGNSTVAVQGSVVCLHAGLPFITERHALTLPGELAGVCVVASVTVSAMDSGKSWPTSSRLYAWRHQWLYMQAADTVSLHAFKPGTVFVWALCADPSHPFILPTIAEDACPSTDSLPPVPLR